MSDIVERLRSNIAWLERDGFATSASYTHEALQEIEALRTDNATLRTALQTHGEEAAKLVENRAAIGELVVALNGFLALDKTFTSAPIGLIEELAQSTNGEMARAVLVARAAITKHDTSSTTKEEN